MQQLASDQRARLFELAREWDERAELNDELRRRNQQRGGERGLRAAAEGYGRMVAYRSAARDLRAALDGK